MEDYSRGLWQAAKVYGMMSDSPETIVLKSTRKKDPKSFVVNKAVLCHYSTYFEKICNGDWKESREGKTEFEVDIPQSVLRLLHGWLFTGRMITDFQPDPLFKLYIYGDYISCVALRRAVISHLQHFLMDSTGSINVISYQLLHDNRIWTEHQNSALYRFITDAFAFHWYHEMDESTGEDNFNVPIDIPVKFVYDQLMIRSKYQSIIHRGMQFGECRCCSSVCKYHEHPNNEERFATCGATFREECDMLTRFCDDDANDNDECVEEAAGEYETQDIDVDMRRGKQEDAGNGSTNGKRKARDDGEEEGVSAKKHKQEEAEP